MWGYTGVQIFGYNYSKEVEQMWGVKWTCIHVLMYVHIITEVWNQRRGDWDINVDHTGAHMFTHNYAKRMEQRWGVRWTSIHVLVYIPIVLGHCLFKKRGIIYCRFL